MPGRIPTPARPRRVNERGGSNATAAAPFVERIFTEYVAGAGIGAIAEGLNVTTYRARQATTARNRHRASAGERGASLRCAHLNNPRYTGREVWNRQRRDEELLDVEDVAAGYQCA